MSSSEASRRYYLAHREEIREKHKVYMRTYREINKEKIRAKEQIYRDYNRVEKNEYARIYYSKNRERILQQRKDKLKKPVWVFEVKHNEKVSFE